MPSRHRAHRRLSGLWPAVAAALLVLSVATPALADLAAAERALQAQDYETALREAQPLAEQGDEAAQWMVDLAKLMIELKRLNDERLAATGPIDLRDYDGRYRSKRSEADNERFNKGLRHDRAEQYEAAFDEWLPLAEAGDAEAQYEIAVLYWLGQGVPADRERAERYLLMSARQGYKRAQGELAQFLNPFGGSKDEIAQRESAYWALRAAANGDVNGYAVLSRAYCYGQGVDKNPVLADVWLYLVYPAKQDFLRHYCNEGVDLPTPYYEAITERAQAMRRAYDIPLGFPDAAPEESADPAGQQ